MNRILVVVALLLAIAETSTRAADVPSATTSPSINLRHTVTVDVVRKTKDAVVYISTTKTVTRMRRCR